MSKNRVLILFFSIFCVCISFSHSSVFVASAESTYYGKVQATGVNLYASPSENSALFELPYSYFVKVEYTVDEFYKVTYSDIAGYVKKDEVTLMNGTPKSPFAEATFSLFVSYSLYRSASEATSLATLAAGQVLTYYGTKTGTSVRSDNNVWYYAKAEIDGEQIFGYVYSAVTDNLTTISVNSEVFDVVSEEVLSDTTTEFSSLSTGTKIMLILAISIPSALILYFLVKPNRIMQPSKDKKKTKNEHKRVSHGDYFELE